MNIKLNLKVLRQMDEDMVQIEHRILQNFAPNDERRNELIKEIQEKRDAILLLYRHYEKVLKLAGI